eukprot:CAMPEP_0194147984 /NCGR_PEP_ID=MMETSP0152-20130528/29313_1 /TAXON_ID=1049557 /ORGANISM="Thalassiothrix antarctica, Strain L6-D1" /LENGTH=127 /DNA_ID=CAMNT_0038849193 /DNA_START=45 /DNA_END=428 /DNA_ORIENTATION=-
MASLQLATKARQLTGINKVARLYRTICKEIPRVMTIYDIDIPLEECKKAVRGHMQMNEHLRDKRVLDMVVEKAYMELEEALLQHKQRPHLLYFLSQGLNGVDNREWGTSRKRLSADATIDEQFDRSV